VSNLYWANSDGTGEVARLTDSANGQVPFSFHPNGKFLAFMENNGTSNWDLMILPIEGDATKGWTSGKPTVFLSTSAVEVFPVFSPDGRWIVYCSNEAGGASFDVYVRPFPGPGGRFRVSTEGGIFPHWSATSNELVFLNQNKVMFATYKVVGDSFQPDKPQVWSPTGIVSMGTSPPYDLHPDGKRLALVAAKEQADVVHDQVVVISNFFDYLWKIAPGKK